MGIRLWECKARRWEQRGTSLVKKQAGEVVYARLQMEKLRQRETVWEDPTDTEQ